MCNAPAGQKKIAPAIARDEPGYRRMFVFAQPHNDVPKRCHTLTVKVEDRPTEYLRKIKHGFGFTLSARSKRMITRCSLRSADILSASGRSPLNFYGRIALEFSRCA